MNIQQKLQENLLKSYRDAQYLPNISLINILSPNNKPLRHLHVLLVKNTDTISFQDIFQPY